ncbi:MAG: gliding motility-associated C-terminal domain-containing protein [Salinivirgaceae bacterium]|nr:gliding motility-associated C-terminal domain-containing protein [Salinivirgaceae bacterium]
MKRHIFTVSILLVAAQLFGQESRFWVGGSGNWSDMSHWAVTSGGEPGAAVPESGTSVVFDENSFSGGRNTVTLEDAVAIGSLTASDANFVFYGKNSLTVEGSVNVDDKVDFGKLRGALVLSATGEKTLNLPSALEGDIVIDGGKWTLTSDLTTEGNITLKSGALKTDGHNMTCTEFSAGEKARGLNIENSTITCDKWNTRSAEFMTVLADGSDIVMRKNIIGNIMVADGQVYSSISSLSESKEYGYKVELDVTQQPDCPANAWTGDHTNGKATIRINDGNGTFNILVYYLGTEPFKVEYPDDNNVPLDVQSGTWLVGYVNRYGEEWQNKITKDVGPANFKGANFGEGIRVQDEARCWGSDITVITDMSGGTMPYQSYYWENFVTGETATTADPSFKFDVKLGESVGLTITDDHGCQIVANGQSPWYYTVNKKHKYNGDYAGPELIEATYDIDPTCEDESTGVLTINPTGGSGAYTKYEVEGKAPQNTPTFSELAAGTYEVQITDSKGCTNYDYKADFNKLTATMTDIPKPVATVENPEATVCFEDGEYTITDATAKTTKSSVDPESILWTVKSGTAASIKSGGNTASPTLTLNAPGDVTFTMTVGNGTCKKATVDKTIHVIPVPVPTLVTANNSKICGLSTAIEANKDALIDGDYSLVAEFVSSEDGTAFPPNGLNVSVSNPGTYIFRVKEIVTTAQCVGYSAELTLKFYNSPTVSLDESSSSICGIDENVPLKAIIANGDVKWSTADGGGTFGNENSAETYYTPVAADLGKTITLTATVDNDGCDPVSANYSLTVNRVPSPAAPIVAAEVCGLATPVSATPSIGGELAWKSTEGTVQFGSGNSTTATVTSATTYHIYVEETKNGCSEVSPAVEVIFYDEPEISITTGTSGKVCGNETFSLAASTNCDETKIVWSGGAGSFSPTTGKNTVYTPAAADYGNTITITASVPSNHPSVCSDPVPATFELTVGNVPAPTIAAIGTGTKGDVCGLSVTATATASLGGTLSWNNGGDNTLQITPSTGATVTVSGDNGVTYGITVTETKDGCSAPSPVQYVTFHAAPEVSVPAASDVCESDIVSVTSTATNATGLNWSITNGAGTFTQTGDASSMTITYTPAAGDINKDVILTATADNGGICSVAEKQYKFHVYEVPSPSVSDMDICGKTGVLTATIASGNTVEWVVPESVSKSNEEINGTTASVTLTLKDGAEYTSYSVGIIESNANCSSTQVDATVTFTHVPVVEVPDWNPSVCAGDEFLVAPDFDYCSSISIAASDMGNFEPIPGEYKAKYKAPKSTDPTSPVLIWITPSGGCNDDVFTITLTVNPKPDPNLSDAVVCGMEYTVPDNTTRSVPNSLLTWVPATGQSNVHIEGGKKFVSTEEGDKYLTVTESAGMCQTEKTAKITFVAKPTVTIGGDDAICINQLTYELAGVEADHFASLEWRSSSDVDLVFSTELNPTYSITDADRANGSVTLSLTAKAKTPCGTEDDVTKSVTITINPLPEPTVSGPATACPNDTDPAVYITEEGMDGYKWYINGALQDGETSNTFSHQWTSAGDYTVSVGYTNGNGCEGFSADFPVKVNTLPESGLAENAESCTSGSVALDATVTSGGSGDFNYEWTGTGVNYLDDPNIANPTFTSDVAGKYTLTCTITDNQYGCSIEATVTIDNKQGPSVNAGVDKVVCYGMPVQMVDADTAFCKTIKWTTSGDGEFDNANQIDATYTPGPVDLQNAIDQNGTTITLTLTATSASCGVVTDDVELTLQPQLQVAVGTVKPFDIQASTKISVNIEGSFNGGGAQGLQFYLVAPDGTELPLYEHAPSSAEWARWPGDFSFEFTTESDVEPSFDDFNAYDKAEAVFSITGDWTDIYGKNPAEGGWSVKLGGKWSRYGVLTRATIVFSDYEDNDPSKGIKKIKFDSKKKNPGVIIPDGQFLSYISPIGLNVSCRNLCDAHAIAKGLGGSGVYTSFDWSTSPGFEEENIIGSGEIKDLCVGTYYVRVTDAAGCTAMIEVEVGAPDDIHVVDNKIADATCNGASDGIIDVSAYKENVTQFQFVIEGFQSEDSNDSWARFSTLPEGTYDLIVIDEDNCSDTVTYNIGQPSKLVITKVDSTLATSCKINNGSVTFTVTGGTQEGDYHFEYMGVAQDQPDIVLDQDHLSATGLSGANGIKFRIWDAATFDPLDWEAGCFLDTTVSTVAEGMELVISQSPNTCNGAEGASITVTVSKGSGEYTFTWYDENGLRATTTEGILEGLPAGTYTVSVEDNNTFCDASSDPIVLTDPDPIVITKTITAMPKCLGDETASFSITAVGGSDILSYAWQKDGASIDNASNSFENVGAGKYTVIVSDGQCDAKDTIEVIEPTSKIAITNVETTESECVSPTGEATVTIDGGYGTITYEWILLRENSVKYSGASNAVTSFGAGSYKLRVQDELGCADSLSVKIADKGGLLVAFGDIEDVTCVERATGTAYINGVYDANGKQYDAQIVWPDGTTHAKTDQITSLKYGDNYITVIADNGCITDTAITLKGKDALQFVEENTFSEPDVLGDPNNNGQIIAVITGGEKAYSYEWFDSNSSPITTNIESGEERTALKGLKEGTYSVKVTDSNFDENGVGCQISRDFTVEYDPIQISVAQTSAVTCYDGKNGELTATVTGGYKNDTYYYEWRNLTNGAIIKSTGSQSVSLDTLKAGDYVVRVMQRNNLAKDSTTVKLEQPLTKLSVPSVLINTTGSYCYEASGSIMIKEPATEEAQQENFGGTLPFDYYFSYSDWTQDSVRHSRQNTEVASLGSGTYTLVVKDARGCLSDTMEIVVPDLSNFTITRIEPKKICNGSDDGVITINAKVNDGSDYQYAWSNNATTKNVDNLKAGTYSVTVTATVKEQYTCEETATFEVEQYAPIMFSVSNSIVNSCYNSTDGVVTMANLRGGNNTYRRFEFFDKATGKQLYDSIPASFADTTATLTFKGLLATGEYKVVVTDGDLNCHSDSVVMKVYAATPKIDIVEIKDDEPLCYEYDKNGNLSYGKITIDAMAVVTSQVSSTTTDMALYFKLDGGDSQKAHIFDNVTAGQHNIVVGYGSNMDCPVEIEHELNSKNNLKANAAFSNDRKAIFTCPDNLLSAYVTANNSYNTYKFYAMYNEDAENYGKVKASEPETQPDTAQNAVAYQFNRSIYYRDGEEAGEAGNTADSTNVTPKVVEPVYNHGKDIRGNNVTLFAQGNGSDSKVWADDFTPYGGATFYYFEIADAQCASIDSIKATSLQSDEKLHASVLNDDDSEARFKDGEYEVAEGVKITLSAEQLQFNFDNAFVYSENSWSWDDAPADKLGGDGVGLVYATTKNGNPVSVMAYGRVMAKVRDSVAFELSDLTYNIDTTMVCYYYDSIIINSISGIKPADVVIANGMSDDNRYGKWNIEGLASYDNVTIYVFNRWGGRVWQYSGTGLDYDANRWDARNEKNKPVPSGTYYYVIQCSDGMLGGKKVTGPVTIIR